MALNYDTIELNIIRAMNSHWQINSDYEQFFIEGQERITNVSRRYIEVKYFGPFYDEDVDRNVTVRIQVHLDCVVVASTVDHAIDQQDIYELNRLTGKMTAIAMLPILVSEYGNCLKCTGIRVLPKGQFAVKTKGKMSTVEADYYIVLDP